jgi:mannose-6-phosphate isomerase-like protein (cupin superfamily)
MSDVTLATFDEMESIYDGIALRARASLGVSAWGMQVMTLPADWDGYPDHCHDATTAEAGQEEVYIPLEGSAVLQAGEESYEIRPGMMVRVGPEQKRRILPGGEGIRFIALGGVPGTAHSPSAWTELGGPLPAPAPQ